MLVHTFHSEGIVPITGNNIFRRRSRWHRRRPCVSSPIREHATFLRGGRKPKVNFSHPRTVVSPRFLTLLSHILYFRIPHNTLCLPPKFCINHCFRMLLGICSVPMQEHLKTIVCAKFAGQTKCIMGNSKIENGGYVKDA